LPKQRRDYSHPRTAAQGRQCRLLSLRKRKREIPDMMLALNLGRTLGSPVPLAAAEQDVKGRW
jgi:hypothetical protein